MQSSNSAATSGYTAVRVANSVVDSNGPRGNSRGGAAEAQHLTMDEAEAQQPGRAAHVVAMLYKASKLLFEYNLVDDFIELCVAGVHLQPSHISLKRP